jgi:hypothetical protein
VIKNQNLTLVKEIFIMKLHEEFKLYENMWDEVPSDSSTENRYIILTGDFPSKYYVHGLTSDGEKEAVDIYNKAMTQLPNFDCDIEVAELFDLTSDEISRLESMIGKEVTGADADFIADFFVDGSRVDSRYNNFNEALTEAAPTTTKAIINRYNDNVADHILELEHEKAFADAEWFEYEWYVLENVEVEPDYYQLTMDRPIESTQNAEAIISYAFGPNANIANISEAMSEGGIVFENSENWIYVERWVVE